MDRISKDSKLVLLPTDLVNKLRLIAGRQGISISDFAADALRQTAEIEETGVPLIDVIDLYKLHETQRKSGSIYVPRSNLNEMIMELYRANKEELIEKWNKAGRWYGEYLQARLGGEALSFLEKSLLVSWNLDEVEIKHDGFMGELKFVSFAMAKELTELLISYVTGVISAFGYEATGEEHLRGLATIYFKKRKNALKL
jgi:hypothetical protein